MFNLNISIFLMSTIVIGVNTIHSTEKPCYAMLKYLIFKQGNVKCFKDLGCLNLTSEWMHPKYRTANVLRADRHAVNTVFVRWIFRDGDVVPSIIGTDDVTSPGIKSDLKLLVHDFTSNGYCGWIQKRDGLKPKSSVHIIAHGVGAHIAGYVGKTTRLRRITALDPAGAHFSFMPYNVRLDKDDAGYVEVVHTDINGQGSPQHLGHVDLFPNGGTTQPGCKDQAVKQTYVARGDLKLGEILPGCSHKRSVKYYIEALTNPSCSFVGVACPSFKDFVKGKCSTCGVNAEHCYPLHPLAAPRLVNNTNGFYFMTSSSTPFCGEMLNVFIALKSKFPDQKYVKGYFNVTVPQTHIRDVSFLLNENGFRALRNNEMYKFMVFRSTPPPLSLPVREIHVEWRRSPLPSAWSRPPLISCFIVQKITENMSSLQIFYPTQNENVTEITNLIGLSPLTKIILSK